MYKEDMKMAAEKTKIRLQGHEKFALREGWINKGLQTVPNYPDAFVRKDAPDIFGIGSNMVKSLRYWMKVFGLTEEKASVGVRLSRFGEIISTYDPYLEKIFTVWILHSFIAKNIEEATTWYMFFNRCDITEFEKNQVENILLREITKYVNGQTFSEKSLSNDVDVLLNMYSKKKDYFDPEDKNVSPFTQLGLVKCLDGKYIKNHPDRKIFSEYIVLYELAEMIVDRESISIDDAIYSEKGLAKIYNLTGVMANEILDKLDAAGFIRVDRTAGLDMIYPVKKLKAEEIIENYYRNVR